MTPSILTAAQEGLRLAEKATKGPWETDHEANEDTRSYYVADAEGKRVCDTLNSEALIEVEYAQDPEDWNTAWDIRGKHNTAFIAHCGTHHADICRAYLEMARNATSGDGAHMRVESCCECGVFVSDWVEAEHRNGRICRPCEHVLSLQAENAELKRQLDEAIKTILSYDNVFVPLLKLFESQAPDEDGDNQ